MSTATPPVRVLLTDGEVAWVRKLEARDAAAVLALRTRLSGRDRPAAADRNTASPE